jgi:hypothetical protein
MPGLLDGHLQDMVRPILERVVVPLRELLPKLDHSTRLGSTQIQLFHMFNSLIYVLCSVRGYKRTAASALPHEVGE